MHNHLLSAMLNGLTGKLIEVECYISQGMPSFTIVGLADTAIQESKERVRSALKNTGRNYPQQKKIINLAPANIKKNGSAFELAIALSILQASGQLKLDQQDLSQTVFLGELSLNGEIKPVKGLLPILISLAEMGFKKVFIPQQNAHEARLISQLNIYPASHLKEVIEHLEDQSKLPILEAEVASVSQVTVEQNVFDLIVGQSLAKQALVIAAASRHHLLLSGSPGVGKTMMARSVAELLPPLNEAEMMAASSIYSAAGLLSPTNPMITRPPFREIHHTSTPVSLTGGGRPLHPGEMTLAHLGVLFLDELAEFPRALLESLRQPLEDRKIHLAREHDRLTFPAGFQLIAAYNPCPCGNFGDPLQACNCTNLQIQKYQKKLSGPLLGRFDLRVELRKEQNSFQHFYQNPPTSKEQLTFQAAREQVLLARDRQRRRFGAADSKEVCPVTYNSQLTSQTLRPYLQLTARAQEYLSIIEKKVQLNPRSIVHLLKTALTIADLHNSDQIDNLHLAEAFQFRNQIH